MTDKTDDELLAEGNPFTERGKLFMEDVIEAGFKHIRQSGLTFDEIVASLLVAAVAAARKGGSVDVLPHNLAIVLARDARLQEEIRESREATKQ